MGTSPVGYEQYEWDPGERVLAHLTFFDRVRIKRPYRAAVPARVADLDLRLAPGTRALMAEATNAIIRFDEQMSAIPVPMPSVLLRSESATSSQIEHLTTSARNLAIASLGLSDKRNAMLVAANVRAMRSALELDGEVGSGLVLRVHEALLAESEPGMVGRFRDQQVWIGGGSLSPHDADFVPPHHTRVEAAMNDLEVFAQRRDIPAVAHAAIHHAQFETIHPFEDGNGRTGRVLLQAVLRRHGVVQHATVPVSAGLLADTDSYFAALTAYRGGDVDPIVRQVSHAAIAAVTNGRMLADEIAGVRERWIDRISARRDSSVWILADALFTQPVVNARWASAATGMSERTARNAVDALVTAGILVETAAAHRNRVWQAPEVLRAMDAFAERAGRRRLT